MVGVGCFLAGIWIGLVLGRLIFCDRPIGAIRVDHSDPKSGPYLFLEVYRGGLEQLHKKKQVVVDAKTEDYLPQK